MRLKKILLICIIIIAVVGILFYLFKNELLKNMYQKDYAQFVSKYAKEYQVEEHLVYSLIKAESNFDENAVSNQKAVGLMQIMEETAKDVARRNQIILNDAKVKESLMDAETNIKIGTKYLATLVEKYQNMEVALAAYNAGIGTVDNWIEKGVIKADGSDIENIPYKETNNYVRKILRYYKVYEEIYK